jgi:hypothetical protein
MKENSNKVRHAAYNPSTNEIPEWVAEPTLISAIEKSGYPLQGVVAEKLTATRFDVVEEWGFIDS